MRIGLTLLCSLIATLAMAGVEEDVAKVEAVMPALKAANPKATKAEWTWAKVSVGR